MWGEIAQSIEKLSKRLPDPVVGVVGSWIATQGKG